MTDETSTAPAAAPAAASGGARRPFFRRRKVCPFSGANAPKIDYKDVKLLQRYVSERGKIVPSRITAVSTKKQREPARAIKRARFLGILNYVIRKNDISRDRRNGPPVDGWGGHDPPLTAPGAGQ